MKRTIKTDGENGVLEIIGNPQETILYLKGKPIQYSWFAEIGSTWRYHIAQGLKHQFTQLNKNIEKLLEKGIKNNGDFLYVTEYFSTFLKKGYYEYGYYEIDIDGYVEIPKEENYEYFDYYGGLIDITPTQNSINENLVDYYKKLIIKGKRPIVILLHVENSPMFYILDGHHKFCAYRKTEVKPYSIIITKLENQYKSIEETMSLAEKMECTNKEYIYWMKREKTNLEHYKNSKLNLEERFNLIKD